MQELEATPQRVISVMWLLAWRGVLGGFLAGFVTGIIVALTGAILGYPQGSLTMTSGVLGGVAGLIWSFFVVRMMLRKNYRDFRIALVARNLN